MNDRELTEAAAKAIGKQGVYSDKWKGFKSPMEADDVADLGADASGAYTFWSPLDNDDEAFRLAVKLRLNITFTHELGKGFRNEFVQVVPKSMGHLAEFGPLGDDPNETIRRAIVRAAAAMHTEEAP